MKVNSQITARRSSNDTNPLSFAQERLWFLDQLEPSSTIYNVFGSYRIRGPLDSAALARALKIIVARHEVLRAVFRLQDDRPVQIVEPGKIISLEHFDLRDQSEESALDLIYREVEQPFDLSRDPMLRAKLFRLHDEEHVLALILHHVASDGWSLGVINRELSEIYAAFTEGRPPVLPVLQIQYADYAIWQRERLQDGSLGEQLGYWKAQLEGFPALSEIPTDHPRPRRQTYPGAREQILLPKDLTSALKSLSQRERCTLFVILLAAFEVLFYRYTGQDDMVIGTPIAGRPRRATEDLIGVFLNTLALRGDVSGNPTFHDLIARVRTVVFDAVSNQDIPFEMLLEELDLERDLSRTPIFQVFFNMLNVPDMDLRLSGLTVEPFLSPRSTSKFDLTLYAREQGDGMVIDWVYNTDLFDELTISTMAARYRNLLEHIVKEPDQPISRLRLLGPSDGILRFPGDAPVTSAKPFERFGKEATEQSIPGRFREMVRRYPGNIAVKTKSHELTYAELDRCSDLAMQAVIKRCGSGWGSVALLFDQDWPMIGAVLGVLKAGKAYVPLDPEHPVERLAYMIADSQASALMADQGNEALCRTLADIGDIPGIQYGEINDFTEGGNEGADAVQPEAIAYILYTSGSTGQPKGVLQSHRNVLRHIRNYTNNLHIGADDNLTLLSSYGFDAAVMDIFGAILNGGTLFPMNLKNEPSSEIRRLLNTEAVTIYHSTPTVLRYLFGGLPEAEAFSSTRCVVLGGEEAYKSDIDLYKRHFPPRSVLFNGLGPSESTLGLQFFVDDDTHLVRNSVPVGFPVEGIEVTLLDEAGCQTDVYGEIAIKGPQIALGYWNNSEATDRSFSFDDEDDASRIYRTGDMGRLLPSGAIEFAGRKDGQLKVRGFRIEPGEVEARLAEHPQVNECVVTSCGTPENRVLAAYFTASGELEPSGEELRYFLSEKLPQYMIPSVFIAIEHLPRTPNGKLDFQALPEPESLPRDEEGDFVAPRSEIETTMAEIWAEAIGVETVGINDDFFNLGGHSLLAMLIVTRIRDQWHVDLPLATFLEFPTVKEMSAVVADPNSTLSPL